MTRKQDERKTPEEIDQYTGEPRPVSPDAGKIVEIVPSAPADPAESDYLLSEETPLESLAADESADAVAERSARYTEDPQIEQVFEAGQQKAQAGRQVLKEDLDVHHARSPDLSGGDLDAAWEEAYQAGEETVGGQAPTPDQDVVENLGEAVGLTYEPDEPLQSEEKLLRRDRERWELNPQSAEDQDSE